MHKRLLVALHLPRDTHGQMEKMLTLLKREKKNRDKNKK